MQVAEFGGDSCDGQIHLQDWNHKAGVVCLGQKAISMWWVIL